MTPRVTPPQDIFFVTLADVVVAKLLPELKKALAERHTATHVATIQAMEERFLSAAEVAKITSLSRETIRQRAIMGQFPAPIHITPKRKAWPLSAVRAWMTEQTKNNANTET